MKSAGMNQDAAENRAFACGLKPAVYKGFVGTDEDGLFRYQLSFREDHSSPRSAKKRFLRASREIALIRKWMKKYPYIKADYYEEDEFSLKRNEINRYLIIFFQNEKLKKASGLSDKSLRLGKLDDAKIGRALSYPEFAVDEFVEMNKSKKFIERDKVTIKQLGLVFVISKKPESREKLFA
jgi:hypothetical protein